MRKIRKRKFYETVWDLVKTRKSESLLDIFKQPINCLEMHFNVERVKLFYANLARFSAKATYKHCIFTSSILLKSTQISTNEISVQKCLFTLTRMFKLQLYLADYSQRIKGECKLNWALGIDIGDAFEFEQRFLLRKLTKQVEIRL